MRRRHRGDKTMQIKGHAAIVTGAGSGLGEATARAFAAKGAKVAVFDVNVAGAERVAKDIGGVAVECNVADPKSAEAAFAKANAAIGVARVLVNCAGIGQGELLVGKGGVPSPVELFQRTISINLFGTFNCMRLFAAELSKQPALADDERGVIINTASVAAFEGQVGQIAYAASKGGVVGLGLPAARELGRYGIRVMTIAPGYIQTPLLDKVPENFRTALLASQVYPNKRFGKASEYGDLCVAIVENTMLNGDVIRLDAATRMPPR
jgi:NAD(P)-dependent dehydrogenase (short-subunit alcohol dehydrogenase family)